MDSPSQVFQLDRQKTNHTPKCLWMLAGVVDYKLCDLEYDCESCPFDSVIRSGSHKLDEQIDNADRQLAAGPIVLAGIARPAAAEHGCDLPSTLFYHQAHIWARVEDGGRIRAGLDDFAQRLMGRIYSVTLPADHSIVRSGEECWRIAHQAGETPLVSPVTGVVSQTNPRLAQSPSLLNRDPYGDGWALLVEPANLEDSLRALLYGQKARSWNETEIEKLYQETNGQLSAITAAAGATLPDGGLRRDFMSELNGDQLRRLIGSFFPVTPEKGDLIGNNAILTQKGR
jgi:glycine cleavage system H lipoate-binding protein